MTKLTYDVSSIPERERVLARRIIPGATAHVVMLSIFLFLSSRYEIWHTTAVAIATTILFFNIVRLGMGLKQELFYPAHGKLWSRVFLSLTFATALGWGLLTQVSLLESGAHSHLFIFILLAIAGIAVGGITSLSPSPALARTFLVSLFAPPVLTLLYVGSPEAHSLSGLLAFYVAFLWAQTSVQGREYRISRQTLSHYRAIAETSGEGIAIHQDGKIVECNRTFAAMMGYETSEIIGMSLTNFCDPDQFQIVANHIRTGSADIYQVIGRRKDGSLLPVEMCGIQCEWDGRPARAARLRDLTEQKRLEASLKMAKENAENEVRKKIAELETAIDQLTQSEERLSAIIYQSPFATQMFSAEGRVTKVNDAFKKLWQLSDEEIKNHVLSNYNLFDDLNLKKLGMIPLVERAFKGEAIALPPTLYTPADAKGPGRARWIETYLAPIKLADGSISELVIISNDVTSRIESDQRLREQQSQIEAIMDHSPAVIFMKDVEGRYLLVNREWETLFNTTRAIVQGKTDYDIRPKEVADRLRKSDRDVLSGGQPTRREEILLAQGRQITFMTIKFPVYDADGKMRGICGIATDITDHKKAEVERANFEVREKTALETSRLKSEFLATMSHEIRTPINGVMGMTDLLCGTKLNPEQREFAEAIKRSGESLLTVINDILDFSKIEAGKIDFESVAFCLEDPIYDVVRSMNVEARKKGIVLALDIESGLPNTVKGDPGRFTQVLNNLVGNAVKFTNRGEVTVRIRRNGASSDQQVEIAVEIEDTGVGIDAQALDRLFKPFSQADASTTRRFGGTGLGLSIAKNLIEKMQGSIGVRSHPGEGSVFSFTLKFDYADELAPSIPQILSQAASIAVAPKPAETLRVLIAEDNPVNQIIAIKMVEKMGYATVAVANGREAIETLRSGRFDLVLMDVQMPELDGLEATRAIRRDLTLRHVPIVALTANAIKGDSDICLASGMNDYLSKPVTAERLGAMVKKWIGQRCPEPETVVELRKAE